MKTIAGLPQGHSDGKLEGVNSPHSLLFPFFFFYWKLKNFAFMTLGYMYISPSPFENVENATDFPIHLADQNTKDPFS